MLLHTSAPKLVNLKQMRITICTDKSTFRPLLSRFPRKLHSKPSHYDAHLFRPTNDPNHNTTLGLALCRILIIYRTRYSCHMMKSLAMIFAMVLHGVHGKDVLINHSYCMVGIIIQSCVASDDARNSRDATVVRRRGVPLRRARWCLFPRDKAVASAACSSSTSN